MKNLLACCAALAALSLPAAISLDATGHVYTDKETPFARGGAPGASWTLTDWRGNPVGESGTWRADGTTPLPKLPTGYYHLKSGADDATFAVVPVPESRTFDHNSFYGIDSAQSWVSRKGSFVCPWNGGDTYRTVSDLLWRSGLPHVRDRLSWSEVNRQPDSLDYSYYMYNADLLRARGILVSGMFHDCPPWAGKLTKLPSDLRPPRSATAWATGSSGTSRTSASPRSRCGTTPPRSRPPISASRPAAPAPSCCRARSASAPTAPTPAPSSTTTPASSATCSTTTPTTRPPAIHGNSPRSARSWSVTASATERSG